MVEEQIHQLTNKLEKIARKNKDRFNYRIEIGYNTVSLVYRFVAFETADNHEFVSGYGNTIEKAVIECCQQIDAACKAWSYKV